MCHTPTSRYSLLAALAVFGACQATPEEQDYRPTIPSVQDRLAGAGQTSCPVYLEERCEGKTRQRCDLYDTAKGAFTDSPDPLLKRALLYDRWYDLFSSPNGLTAERVFKAGMPATTPESEWSSIDSFSGWSTTGDAAIWTGAALVSDIFRYAQTGTEADYQRMEDKVRALVRNFEVTGIPGYLARYHFLLLPEGSPNSDKLIVRFGDESILGNRDNPIEAGLSAEGLPPEYKSGVPDGSGGTVKGKAYWHGRPSIDQYSGPMTAFPIAYHLLRDEKLKAKIVRHLTCYLKRLRRMEIINLDKNPTVRDEVTKYFAGVKPRFDPGDPDLMKLDRLVAYYNAGINRTNAETFDRSCPDAVTLTPTRVVDASKATFIADMLVLAQDLNMDSAEMRENQVDHFYIANIRGGDASHLMHLAAMAHHLTGDEQYLKFLEEELIGNLNTVEVAKTMMAFRLPDWCFKFYGDHITYGTHWQFITMLGSSRAELRDAMIQVMEEEAWQKALYNHHNAKFNVMYASVVPDGVATGRDEAIKSAVDQLRDYGGNGGVLEAPRRSYNLDAQHVIDNLPSGTTVRCPTEEERIGCEEGADFFGIPLESKIISYECDGRPGECKMADGKCVRGLASEGLPVSLRPYSQFIWQRSPFELGVDFGEDGQKQGPSRDFTESYWLARHFGFIEGGSGQVLAWRDVGSCN